jgi:hypothetical protein
LNFDKILFVPLLLFVELSFSKKNGYGRLPPFSAMPTDAQESDACVLVREKENKQTNKRIFVLVLRLIDLVAPGISCGLRCETERRFLLFCRRQRFV